MNELLEARYDEIVHRLAAGIEPVDAIRGARAGDAVHLHLEYPTALRGARPRAHAGGRWSIRYGSGLPDHVDVRIEDDARRLVPRRLRLPIVPLQDVRDAEHAGGNIPASQRSWRPALLPGAAYATAAGATGFRGHAVRGGAPARWVRVEARLRGTAEVLWRAHGDDRGEFLLVAGPDPRGLAEIPDVIPITVAVFAANPAPVPPAGGAADPLWDLPLETAVAPGPDDPVSRATTLPPGYRPGGVTASRDIDLVPGRVLAGPAPFDLV